MTISFSNNAISLVNQKYFDKYEEYKDLLKDKIFLYSEIHPKKDELLLFRDDKFEIVESFNIEIIGSLTNPKRSLKSILTACYKCEEFLSSNDCFLFVYNGFKSSEEEFKISESAVQLKFVVYKLNKI